MKKMILEPATLDFGAVAYNPINDLLKELGLDSAARYSRYKIVDVKDDCTDKFFDTLYRDVAIRMLLKCNGGKSKSPHR
jgi:hypothetical protein